MRLTFKGIYKGPEQLPRGSLPENAIMFDEPKTPSELNKRLISIVFLTVFILAIIIGVIYSLRSTLELVIIGNIVLLASFIYLPALIVHELLHAICFGKNSNPQIYFAPTKLMAFVVCTTPISKARFIFMSALPTFVLGVLPLFLWAVLPYHEVFSNFLLYSAVIHVLSGVGDYLNIYNAIRQMPAGSMQQLSGFNSYWFMP